MTTAHHRDPHDMPPRYLLVGDVVRATATIPARAWGRSVGVKPRMRGVVVQVHGSPHSATTYGIAFGEAFAHVAGSLVTRVSEPWTAAWEADAAAWAMSEMGAYLHDEPPDVPDPWVWDEDSCGPAARWPAVEDEAPIIIARIEAQHAAGSSFVWRYHVLVDDGAQVAPPSGVRGPWCCDVATLSEAMMHADICRRTLEDHYRDVAGHWTDREGA